MSERLLRSIARLRRYNLNDYEPLKALAAEDNHFVLLPSHSIEKEGEFIGHISLGTIPLWIGHLSKRKTTPYDSHSTIGVADNLAALNGWPGVMTLMDDESPLCPLIHKFGYNKIGKANIFFKGFI